MTSQIVRHGSQGLEELGGQAPAVRVDTGAVVAVVAVAVDAVVAAVAVAAVAAVAEDATLVCDGAPVDPGASPSG